MQIEIPMVAKIKAEFRGKIEIDSFMDGSVEVWGPKDKDKDGDPEFYCKIDLPGEAFDKEWSVEIPLSVAFGGIPKLAKTLLEKGPDFPFKSIVVKSVEQILQHLEENH